MDKNYFTIVRPPWSVIIILLFCLDLLNAQSIDKRTAGGLSVQIGTGLIYGGNGAMIDYQIPMKSSFRISPSVGLGLSLGGSDSSKAEYYWFNYSAGLTFEYGTMHRLIFSPHFCGSHNVHNHPATASINKKTLYGPSIIIGYKGTAPFGLIWQVAIGVVYYPDPLSASTEYTFHPHINLGVGYKF